MPGEHFSVGAKFSDEGPGPDENIMKAHLTVHCWFGTRARWLVLALSLSPPPRMALPESVNAVHSLVR